MTPAAGKGDPAPTGGVEGVRLLETRAEADAGQPDTRDWSRGAVLLLATFPVREDHHNKLPAASMPACGSSCLDDTPAEYEWGAPTYHDVLDHAVQWCDMN